MAVKAAVATAIGLVLWACSGAAPGERGEETARTAARSPTDSLAPPVQMVGPSDTARAEQGEETEGERLEGRVLVTGSDPLTFPTLQFDDGSSVRLTGGLVDELERLSGARVRAAGTREGHAPLVGFQVSSYEVLEVEGERPVVGIVTIRGVDVWLVGTVDVRLRDVPHDLRATPGAKVWVIGPRRQGEVSVQSYGVIREGS